MNLKTTFLKQRTKSSYELLLNKKSNFLSINLVLLENADNSFVTIRLLSFFEIRDNHSTRLGMASGFVS